MNPWELVYNHVDGISYHGGVVYDNRIYSIGGLIGAANSAAIGSSPNGRISDTVVINPTGLSVRRGAVACMFDNRVFIVGGYNGVTGKDDVLVSKDLKSWETLFNSPSTIYSHRMVVFGNPRVKLVFVGGYCVEDNAYLDNIFTSSDGRNWEEVHPIGPMWSRRSGHGLLVYKGKLWLFGGHIATVSYNDVWWTDDLIHWHLALADAPWSARQHFGFCVWDERMWLIGGESADPRGQGLTYSRETWYTRDGSTWKQAFDFPTDLSRTFVGVVDNRMLVVCGRGNEHGVYQLNLG
jgi:hypothetical protein